MNFDEAKNLFVEKYSDFRFEFSGESDKELWFTHPRFDRQVRLPVEDITEYLAFEVDRLNFNEVPVECSICSKSYREHMIPIPIGYFRVSRFNDRDESIYFGDPNSGIVYAQIGEASNIYHNYFRFNEFYEKQINRLPMIGRNANLTDDYFNMNDLQRRPITIKVINIHAPDIEAAVKISDNIIESCLFQLSYMKNITSSPAEEWLLKRETVQPFHYKERVRGNRLAFPRIVCNSDLLRFYQRGMSSDDPVLQFLSFYQVLEYFFLEVSDELLYNKLSRKLKDPEFALSTKDLDGIIREVTKHKGETDETEMLKLVLNKYIDEEDLMKFIKDYESHFSEKIYTKKQNLFGAELEVKLQSGHLISNIAKRIKVIRNALVHASDLYERGERYIPNNENEFKVKREVPLMQLLAEKTVIASSATLEL